MDAKISVIVPVYRVEKYLEECVDSILAQTYPIHEIILVDDGSPDRSGEICDRYASLHPDKIRVIHKPNGGLSSARNVGLDAATGDYISFIDSDDKILPEMYSEMVEAMEEHSVEIVASKFHPWNKGHKRAIPEVEPFTGLSDKALSLCLNWKLDRSAVTKLYHRSAIGDLRFHEGLTNEDFPFICELYLKRLPIHVMNKGYYLYRNNDNSISTVFRPSFFDVFTNIEYVDGLISPNDVVLRPEFDRHTLLAHIMSATHIVVNKKNREYIDWLRRNRKYILRHLPQLLFDPKITARWRVKALISFLRLPV